MTHRLDCLVTALLLAPAAASAQAPIPLGPEFVVSAGGYETDVAMNASGAFEVVWGNGEISAQRFDASGTLTGPPVQVNAYTTGAQYYASVVLGDDGRGLTFWVTNGEFGSNPQIASRQLGPDGAPVGADAQATAATDLLNFASAAGNGRGDVVLTWIQGLSVNLVGDVYARRFGLDGTPRGGGELVQTRTGSNTTADQRNQSVAIDAAGNHVVVWQDDGRTTNTSVAELNIAMRRYMAAGTSLGPEQRVNTTLAGNQVFPDVAMNAAGAFTVVWHGDGPQGYGVYLQHYDASGARRGGEVRVDATQTGYAGLAKVVLGARGDAVVVWVRSSGQVVLRRIDRDGAAASGEVLVGTTPVASNSTSRQTLSVASNESGALVVVWAGTNGGVFAQRFALAPVAGEAAPEAPAALAVSVAPVPAGVSGATVRYTLATAGEARVTVVDALGREVAVLADEAVSAGAHDVRFATAGLAPGVYAVRVEAGGAVAVARVPVVR